MPKPLNEQTIIGDILHEWIIQDYEKHERGPWWYVIMLTLGLILVVIGLFTSNFLFSLIIILAAIILFLQSHQEPLEVDFAITELGIIINDRFYPYGELDEFYIIYQPPQVKTLFLETKTVLRPALRIPLLDQNPVEVRHTLLEYMNENLDKEEEPLSDKVAREWRIH